MLLVPLGNRLVELLAVQVWGEQICKAAGQRIPGLRGGGRNSPPLDYSIQLDERAQSLVTDGLSGVLLVPASGHLPGPLRALDELKPVLAHLRTRPRCLFVR